MQTKGRKQKGLRYDSQPPRQRRYLMLMLLMMMMVVMMIMMNGFIITITSEFFDTVANGFGNVNGSV